MQWNFLHFLFSWIPLQNELWGISQYSRLGVFCRSSSRKDEVPSVWFCWHRNRSISWYTPWILAYIILLCALTFLSYFCIGETNQEQNYKNENDATYPAISSCLFMEIRIYCPFLFSNAFPGFLFLFFWQYVHDHHTCLTVRSCIG